ncbi:hypothetical protein DM01DRAFT_1339160 [Hesseltinella vesiculosa]|uniref:Uncharacterized protein n=1 Tax=Hesseltinella vesiculosa TaxID=101127 RepID=A0A1X2G7L2_9FUNG|nr:hypothetical protein DM01DRAFT_1339160 [Hesseltinella vesiculosa]
MEETWNQFKVKASNSALYTEDATVTYVPSGLGAKSKENIRRLYLQPYFSQKATSVTEVVHNQVKGGSKLMEEVEWIITFHHGECNWLVPGLEEHQLLNATVKIPVVISAEFEGSLISRLRFYWDQGSVLKQLRLVSERNKWPVIGVEQVAVFHGKQPEPVVTKDVKLPEKFNPGKNAFVPGRIFGPVHPDDEVSHHTKRHDTSQPQRNIFTYVPPEQKPLVAHNPNRLESSFSFGNDANPTSPSTPSSRKVVPENRNIFAQSPVDQLADNVQALNISSPRSANATRNIFTHQ